jgi:hypothetical protein
LKVERPPEIWEVLGDEGRVAELLEAMIRAATTSGASLDELTLNVSNVVVEPPDDDEPMTAPRPGEYVALTITAPSDLGPDGTWQPGAGAPTGVLNGLVGQCQAAGVLFAYVRRIPGRGSLTVFLPHLASKA